MKLMLQVILIVQLWYRAFNWMVRQSRVIAVYQKSQSRTGHRSPTFLVCSSINLFLWCNFTRSVPSDKWLERFKTWMNDKCDIVWDCPIYVICILFSAGLALSFPSINYRSLIFSYGKYGHSCRMCAVLEKKKICCPMSLESFFYSELLNCSHNYLFQFRGSISEWRALPSRSNPSALYQKYYVHMGDRPTRPD